VGGGNIRDVWRPIKRSGRPVRSHSQMNLTQGTRLEEILGAHGAGGMREVLRARDPRLGRDIAIKLLHGDVADRRHRFETEARTIRRSITCTS